MAIDNKTGEVRAMVGGDDYNTAPFNLATQGQRQPGSAFKPFILAEALKGGISPTSLWSSRKKVFDVPGSIEKFTVENYSDAYAGVTTLANATTTSDNSVFAEVGIKVGTKKVAKLARRMGIRTPVSHNWAMTLGGLEEGVTPLDMAHAYQTFARKGKLVYGSLSPGTLGKNKPVPGPVGIHAITRADDDNKLKAIRLPNGDRARNKVEDPPRARRGRRQHRRHDPPGRRQERHGAARRSSARCPVAGKTGTTENYGDAWFVGWTPQYTVAVWVGYPKKFQPMKTEFQGKPVAGGTYPAGIWKTFMERVLKIDPPPELKDDDETEGEPGATPAPGAGATPAPAAPAPAPEDTAPETGGGETAPAQPEEPAPEEPADIPPAEQPPTAPEGGGGETTPPSGGTAPPAPGAG